MFKLFKKEWQPILLGLLFLVYAWVGFKYLWDMDHRTVRYDCRMAEISPDFPPDVKNECRKLNSGRL